MAHLNLSFEDLASVICLACHLGNADGDFSESEMQAILTALGEQYNFEGREDLLRQYINAGFQMEPQEAIRRISAFGPVEKQWTSNFFVKTIVADDNLEESEKSLYWDIMEKCGLPEHNLDGGSNQDNTPSESPLSDQIIIAFEPRRVSGEVYDTTIRFIKYPFEKQNLRDNLFEWFNNAETLQFVRSSTVLDKLNSELGLQNGWHLLLVHAKKDYWLNPSVNKAATMIGRDGTVYGPALLLVEGEGKVAKGCQFESFVSTILGKLYEMDNNFLIEGEDSPALTRRYLVTALTALEVIPKQE